MRYVVPRTRIIAGILLSVLAAGCGGGGNAARSVAATPRDGSATVRLTIPAASSTSATLRAPRYVSPSTKSLLISVQTVNGQATTFPSIPLNVVVPSAACPAPAQVGESEVCTFSVILPVGSVGMTVSTYDQPITGSTPSGNLLSSVSVTQQLSGNGDPILLTLNGVPASATLSLGTPIAAVGTAASIAVTATALDADGNLIVGPGNYAPPITVAVTDPTGRVTVTQGSIAAPGGSATLAYNGAAGLTKVTVSGSATGVTVHGTTLAFVPGLVRSDALPQITLAVHELAVSPDGSTIHIPYQDASNANAPTLLAVSAATRTVIAHPQLVTQAPGNTAIAYNVAYSNGGAFVPYSDGNTVNGVADVIISSSTVAAHIGTAFAAQFLVTAPNSSSGFLYGTPLGGGAGAIYDFVGSSAIATSASVTCAVWDQCLAASPDGALIYGADAAQPGLVTMHVADGSAGPTIATPDGPVTAQAFSANGSTLYLASAASGGTTDLDALAYPSGTAPVPFVTVPEQFSALATSADGATLFGSSSLSPSPIVLVDIASKTVVSFGPAIALGSFAGGFVSPVPIANVGAARRFLVLKQYQQPAGTLHTTLDEYTY